MKKETRLAFNAYRAQIAQLNGVDDVSEKFAIEPSVEQKMEQRVQESSDFLQEINIVPVDQQTGEVLGLGTSGPIASRTDTSVSDRQTRDISDMSNREYLCAKTDFDSHIKYNKMDMWAKFPNFQNMMRDNVIKQIARDRLMIGWNGTSRAANTDFANNQLLQDVNIGWLQKLRNDSPERVLAGVKISNTLADPDFKNIDAAVLDAIDLLDPWYQESSDVVCICGRSLVTDKYVALVNDNNTPTEKQALNMMLSNKQIGAKRTVVVPYFPANSILLTPLDNLSIYWQEGTRRRTIEDNAKRDRVEDYQSVNEDYVIEDLGACAFLDNIVTEWV